MKDEEETEVAGGHTRLRYQHEQGLRGGKYRAYRRNGVPLLWQEHKMEKDVAGEVIGGVRLA